MPVATVSFNGSEFSIQCKHFDNHRASALPDRKWDDDTRLWFAPVNLMNAQYINKNYTQEEMSGEALTHISEVLALASVTEICPFPKDFIYKNQPRPYQSDALDRAYGMREFALLMEMRTGKSYVDIQLAAQYYLQGDISLYVIVMFPSSIKSTWKIQLEEHMPIPYELHMLQAGKKKQTQVFIDMESDKLKILVIGIESLSQGNAPDLLTDAINKHKTKFTIDESTCIKNPKALTSGKVKKRTRVKLCWDLGGLCEYRTIMTGTPITQGIQDLYSQFRFLNWNILGYKSYYAFQNAHCVMGGFEMKKIMGYNDINKVINSIIPFSYQISTEDAIGIPEEIVQSVIVEQSSEQKRMLKELGDPYDMSTQLEGVELEVETILERMIRYQQIVGGHFPFKEGKSYGITSLKINPKLNALMGIIETLPKDKKMIIWARFVPELNMISDALDLINESHTGFRSGMTDDEREEAQIDFMNEGGSRFWVSSQQTSARGVELASASVHVFFSSSFSYDDRKQASMRTNSSHQTAKSILYIDIVMDHKIDKQIIDALQKKKDVADYVTDEIKNKQGSMYQ